jgi:outer membrane protein OmpA-like peptidoglycan-associated protein/tetratricopeptide (TPR) repeat protein
MLKNIITLLIAAFVLNVSFAQKGGDIPFEKEFFKDNKSEFKEAKKFLEEGLAMIEVPAGYFANYAGAIPLLKKAYAFNPKSADLNFKLGICEINSQYKFDALHFFQDAYELKPTVDKAIHYFIGYSKQLHFGFDEALYEYKLYRNTLNQKDDLAKIRDVNKRIDECNSGVLLIDKPIRVWIDNLGKQVNSKYPDYAGVISADESVIIYTSRRESGTGEEMTGGMYMEDIFISEKSVEGKWQLAKGISDRINTKNHDATVGLSNDGLMLFTYYDSGKNTGDLFSSTKQVDGWSKLEDLGKNINNKDTWETGASISFDKKTLYFVSNRDGGAGERDIWKSKWDDEKERWGEAENCGNVINTPYDEVGIFAHPDGKTFYFSSKGHTSMGGFDIFKVIMNEDGTFNPPTNLGFPVNSPDDDVHFVMAGNGRHGYYSSFKEDGYGEKDIYIITFLGEEKIPLTNAEDNLLAMVAEPIKEKTVMPKVQVSQSDLAILKGVVRDEKTQKPLEASIELVDNSTGQIIQTFKSDPVTGRYLVSLPSGKNYGIAVKANGYLFHSENFDIPKASGYMEYEKNVDLKKIEVGKAIVLRNIFFDLAKYSLRPESKTELARLKKLMDENPTLKIELSGHTDTRGSSSNNKTLSLNRAKAVVDYLAKAGIAGSRMVSEGFGEEKTIISDTEIGKLLTKAEKEAAHQGNRRTEFKILSL